LELFELELAGGAAEQRYRATRPEVEAMPWGSIDPSAYPQDLILGAQKGWTRAAFQEYRTGAACAAMLRTLLEARAPLDLIALATRFPLDEVVHAELCARFAMSIGGAAALEYDPAALVPAVGNEADDALLKAAHQAVAFFCVGETMSVPLLHGSWKAATHPLTRAVLKCIVTDEADHGAFGWAYLDWALPHLEPADLDALRVTAESAIESMCGNWDEIRARPTGANLPIGDMGWMANDAYVALAERSLQKLVIRPLRERGIPVRASSENQKER
jgi:hypothetical protein